MEIRTFVESDRAELRELFGRAGEGAPTSSLWGHQESEAAVYLTPYMDQQPDSLFLAVLDGALTGYRRAVSTTPCRARASGWIKPSGSTGWSSAPGPRHSSPGHARHGEVSDPWKTHGGGARRPSMAGSPAYQPDTAGAWDRCRCCSDEPVVRSAQGNRLPGVLPADAGREHPGSAVLRTHGIREARADSAGPRHQRSRPAPPSADDGLESVTPWSLRPGVGAGSVRLSSRLSRRTRVCVAPTDARLPLRGGCNRGVSLLFQQVIPERAGLGDLAGSPY